MPMPTRLYGKKKLPISVIGFGAILVMNAEQEKANRLVAEAVERGVSYFDVAPAYGDAQYRLGPALEPYRKDVFLACKTGQRKADEAKRELEESLKAMRTDYFDLYQLHAVTKVEEDIDVAFGKGGVMEVLIEAKEAGILHHLGFSAHSEEAAIAAMERYDFDSILFPINFCTWHQGNFGHKAIAMAEEKGVTRLALKAMALQHWQEGDPKRGDFGKCWYEPVTDPDLAVKALRWTLSQGVAAALPPGEEEPFRWALDAMDRLSPVTTEEEAELKYLADSLKPIFQSA